MTRQDVLNEYYVSNAGIITTPGKFEGEMLYVPYFWDSGLNGFPDDDINNVWFFVVDADDRRQFPELGPVYGISLEETDGGFVYATTYDKTAYDKALAYYAQADEDEE